MRCQFGINGQQCRGIGEFRFHGFLFCREHWRLDILLVVRQLVGLE